MTDDDEVLRRRVKAELRKRIRGLRATAPLDACAARSAKIIERLGELEVVRAARAVALFWPITERHEVDLRALDAALRARGAKVAYPAIDPETRAMTFKWAAPDALEERGFGFREPAADAPACARGELDVIVVPAIALAPSGHRIGYGAGYYDRTIPEYSPPAATVGVVYDYQLLAEVPSTPGDVAVDWIVTDARAFTASPSASAGPAP
jgi:5-formyltetrahydrofolate cyclo-ligase